MYFDVLGVMVCCVDNCVDDVLCRVVLCRDESYLIYGCVRMLRCLVLVLLCHVASCR